MRAYLHRLVFSGQSGGYARTFKSPGSWDATNNDLPASDAGKSDGTYPLGPTDEPAAEAMGKGGQYQRLLLALVILLGEGGAYLLLGALAVGVIIAQILLLMLLGFAPAALLIAIFPGRGHEFFRAWLAKLAGYLARKVIYSLILAVVLAICAALEDATSNLGWLLAFALQAAFLWTVFLQRNRLASDLLAGTVGPRAAKDATSRLANLYYATRLARMTPTPSIPRSTPRPPSPAASPTRDTPDGEGPPAGEGPSATAPPPTVTPSSGTPGGQEHFADEEPPTTSSPGANGTPTHGPGAPNPSSAGTGTPHTGEPSTPRRAGAEPPEDELAQTDTGIPSSATASNRSRESATGAHPPTPRTPAAVSTASTPLPAPPQPVAPRAPVAVEPPPAGSTTGDTVPGIPPRRSSGNDLDDGDPSRPISQPDVARSGHDQPQLASPASATGAEEPVSRLLRARYATSPTDPTNQEDKPA